MKFHICPSAFVRSNQCVGWGGAQRKVGWWLSASERGAATRPFQHVAHWLGGEWWATVALSAKPILQYTMVAEKGLVPVPSKLQLREQFTICVTSRLVTSSYLLACTANAMYSLPSKIRQNQLFSARMKKTLRGARWRRARRRRAPTGSDQRICIETKWRGVYWN